VVLGICNGEPYGSATSVTQRTKKKKKKKTDIIGK
jgi:hypothetical protein